MWSVWYNLQEVVILVCIETVWLEIKSVHAVQCLSEYAENLPSDAKAWYEEKLDFIGGIDPFQTRNVGELDDFLPDVDASDLVSLQLCMYNQQMQII